jgi:hypothetical protein
VIRHWSFKKGAARALAAWRKHRAKRTAQAAAPVQPTIAGTVRRPTAPTVATAGGPRMSGQHFVAPAMEAVHAAARYEPTGMVQVIEDFAGLQQACELEAEAIRISVEKADARYPLDPRVIDTMREIHNLKLKAAELAGELRPAALKLHDADLARHTSPRKGREGERMWDTTSN